MGQKHAPSCVLLRSLFGRFVDDGWTEEVLEVLEDTRVTLVVGVFGVECASKAGNDVISAKGSAIGELNILL